ncbi:NAD kinase [Alphaproteobacteria bacterium]
MLSNKYKNIGCVFNHASPLAVQVFHELLVRCPGVAKIDVLSEYSLTTIEKGCEYDLVITIGGDGLMLKALHHFMGSNVPVFGINCGSIGFLLNDYVCLENFIECVENAVYTILHPLEMVAITEDSKEHRALAVNEVSLLRQTHQSAKISVSINNKTRLEQLSGDGIMVSTPAGSSAYNFAAHGPIIPLEANVLLLTPINAFRPRRWHGALIPRNSAIKFDVLDCKKRPVNSVADFKEVVNVMSVEIIERKDISMILLFDSKNPYEERILKEQFMCY